MVNQVAKWYVINVYSGSENRVAQSLNELAEKRGMSEYFEEILVPTEEVIEIKNGEKVSSDRKFFPGYILVKMVLNDDAWHLVRSIPRVSGFLGNKNKPLPISEAEVKNIKDRLESTIETPVSTMSFEIGDSVTVCDGPFSSFSGYVEEVDTEKARIKVSVMIFGRPTLVSLEYTQVKKQ